MNCITRYVSFAKLTGDDNLYEKGTIASFLQFLLGEDLTGYQLPTDLGSKSALYDRMISEMLGRYWEKPIGKTYLPPWEEEIPEETIEKIVASWTRRFLGVLNRTHERYILLLESYAGAKSKMMDDVKSIAKQSLDNCEKNKIKDWTTLKNGMKSKVSEHLYRETKRKPMILPVIMEV